MKFFALLILIWSTLSPGLANEENNEESNGFKFIKLGPLLKERQQILEQGRGSANEKLFNDNSSQDPSPETLARLKKNDEKINMHSMENGLDEVGVELQQALYETAKSYAKNNDGGLGDETSPVFQRLQHYLSGKFEGIGSNQTQSILKYNEAFNLGSHNFSGFTWEKPMGNFHIGVNRQLAPDLFDDVRWIVTDTFVVRVDATTYLNRLNDGEMIDMSEQQIRAFAGLSFQRTYRYEHFADSFFKGLTSDFSKLFMSFLKFRKSAILNLAPYEYITKEDYFTMAAGGMVSANFYGISVGAGAVVSFDRVAKVTIQSLGPNDLANEGEFLRLSIEKSKSTSVGVTVDLKIDLMKILKLHLFTYDFEYELKKTQSAHLSFYEADKPLLMGDTPESKEFHKLLKLRLFEVDALMDNVVSLEERTSQITRSKYQIFHYGNLKKNNFESVRFVQDGTISTFFKHHYLHEKVEKNIWGKLFGGFLLGVLGLNHNPRVESSFSKYLAVEYHAEEPQKPKRKPASIEEEDDLSMTFTQEFTAHKTTKKRNKSKFKRSKRRALSFMKQYTALPAEIIDNFKTDNLKGPLRVRSTIQIEKDGIDYLNSISTGNLFYIFAKDVCKSKRASKWRKHRWRKRYLKRMQIMKAEICTKNLGKKYLSYKSHFDSSGRLPIFEFRKFMEYLRKKSRSKHNFYKLFDRANVNLHGSLKATTSHNQHFQTFFNDGEFKGLGVIDNYLRTHAGMITPLVD